MLLSDEKVLRKKVAMSGSRFSKLLLFTLLMSLPALAFASSEAPPTADFIVLPLDPTVNDVIILDASLTQATDAPISLYEWDFDSDGQVDFSSNQPQTRHFFNQSGNFDVTLHVSDNAGGRDSFTQNVDIAPAAAIARRTFETTLEPNQVLAGGSIFITVTVELNQDASGLGLVEVVPAGWRTRPMDDGNGIFKRSGDEMQWLWAQSFSAGDTVSISYEVSVPSTTPRGDYAIEGSVSSFSPDRFRLPVFSLLGIEVL